MNLRWGDLDMLGHVSHSVYHELLEEGRASLLEEAFPNGLRFDAYVLASVAIDYRSEIRHDHGFVDVVVRLTHVGTSSLSFEHEIILPGGRCAASGRSVLVAWDGVRRAKRPLSGAELDVLSGLVATGP